MGALYCCREEDEKVRVKEKRIQIHLCHSYMYRALRQTVINEICKFLPKIDHFFQIIFLDEFS